MELDLIPASYFPFILPLLYRSFLISFPLLWVLHSLLIISFFPCVLSSWFSAWLLICVILWMSCSPFCLSSVLFSLCPWIPSLCPLSLVSALPSIWHNVVCGGLKQYAFNLPISPSLSLYSQRNEWQNLNSWNCNKDGCKKPCLSFQQNEENLQSSLLGNCCKE